jgi:D-arabinose 1-dehydrogenase-like Zn-dependent alcohol dehydrogenase
VKAAVLDGFNEPLDVREVDAPEPGIGEVIVRTRAAGICRTDLKVVDGSIPTVETPRIVGHELAGEIAAIGPGVPGVEEGARVAVGLDITCSICAYCRRGELDHCADLVRLGLEQDGALAEYVRVPAANLIDIPPNVSFAEAATVPDAIGSPYHAVVNRAGVGVGDIVAVYGLGGLGLIAVQVAAIAGARVIAIARTEERRRLAEELGATWSIDPNAGEVSTQVRDLTEGLGVDAFIDVVGIDGSVEQGARSCRKGGKVVVVGYVVPQLTTEMTRLVLGEVAIMGSRSSTRGELIDAMSLVGIGRIRPVIGAEFRLEEVNEAMEQLRAGTIIGRAVVTFP